MQPGVIDCKCIQRFVGLETQILVPRRFCRRLRGRFRGPCERRGEQKHQNKDDSGVVNAKGADHATRIVRKSDNVKIKGLTLKFLRNMNDLLDKAGKGVYKATNSGRKTARRASRGSRQLSGMAAREGKGAEEVRWGKGRANHRQDLTLICLSSKISCPGRATIRPRRPGSWALTA
jgi:hypothetical protein